MTKLVIIERKTGNVGHAVRKENGKYLVSVEGHSSSKEYSESTFKKYFKLTGDTTKEEEPKAETKAEEPKAQQKKTAKDTVARKAKMIETVKKLLALAGNNPSESEATSAAVKAQKLMAEYHIEMAELGEKVSSTSIEEELATCEGKPSKWRSLLAATIARNFRCEVYRTGDTFTFYGYKEDAEVAKEVFSSMYAICYKMTRKLKRSSRKNDGTAKGVGISFALGFVAGIKSELEKQTTSLMIVTPKEVTESFAKKTENFKHTSIKGPKNINGDMYNKGFKEGKSAINGRELEMAQ